MKIEVKGKEGGKSHFHSRIYWDNILEFFFQIYKRLHGIPEPVFNSYLWPIWGREGVYRWNTLFKADYNKFICILYFLIQQKEPKYYTWEPLLQIYKGMPFLFGHQERREKEEKCILFINL